MQVDVEMQPAFLQGNDFQLWDESISMQVSMRPVRRDGSCRSSYNEPSSQKRLVLLVELSPANKLCPRYITLYLRYI